MTRTSTIAALLALLGGPACAVTAQELRAMHGELSVQIIGRVEEAIARENEKLRAQLEKRAIDDRKAVDNLGVAGTKSRAALEEEIKQLRVRLDELQNVLLQVKKSTQTGGGSSAVIAELDVRAIGENQYRVSRKQFGEFAYELTRLAAQIPLVAHFEGDKRVGLRVVDSNALVGRFGILAGDVILSVNDVALRAPEQTREVIAKLRKERRVVVNVVREKQPIQIVVIVGD